jgi:hypothetical protein
MNLPVVPACARCNDAKSKLEHYLTSVMPFGGRHPDASDTLSTLVPERLAKNRPLWAALGRGLDAYLVSRNGGSWQPEARLPVDGPKLTQWLDYVTRGLAYWHCNIYVLPERCLIRAGFLNADGQAFCEKLLAGNAGKRTHGHLGEDVFVYEGLQSAEHSELTVWRFSLYGAAVGADSRSPRMSNAYAITAPKNMTAAADIERAFGIPR